MNCNIYKKYINMNKTEILYPIFLSLAAQMQSDDRFYRFLYEDMAYGKTPYGIYIQDSYLVCYRKNKEFSLKLIDDDENILQEIHSLLKNRACVLSEKDNIKKIDMYLTNDNIDEKYKNKKSYRDNLIQNYILRKGEKHKIHVSKLKKLVKLINNGLLFKIISCDDFTFEKNHSIKDIKGIYFSDRSIEVDPELFSKFIKSSTTNIPMDQYSPLDEYDSHLSNKIITIGKLWDHFLNEFPIDIDYYNTCDDST